MFFDISARGDHVNASIFNMVRGKKYQLVCLLKN